VVGEGLRGDLMGEADARSEGRGRGKVFKRLLWKQEERGGLTVVVCGVDGPE